MTYLYRYETKGIQNWILSSNKLRDLAGGSALIEALTQSAESAAKGLGATVIQATSGAMTAEFPDVEKLEAFASEWSMQVAFRTPGLQLVQAWGPSSLGLAPLFKQLAAKRNTPQLNDLETNPWVLRAGLSGLPAVPKPKSLRSKARQSHQDQVSLAKEWALQREHYGKELPVTGGHDWDDFEQELDQWPEGPVAVIHADGTGVGQRLMNLKGGEALQRFSKAMKEASSAAIAAAVAELTMSRSRPFWARPVVSAGDDLTYIVPAGDARRFTEAWLRAFERETGERAKDLGGGQLYGGAGIVMVHRGYPFSSAYQMAETLCKKAKDKVKGSRNPNRSVMAFKRITNSLVDEVDHDAVGWIVTEENPLCDLVTAVRDLPRGTLRTWLDHFQRPDGTEQAQRLWNRAREVADKGRWERFGHALKAAGADPETGELSTSDNGLALKLGNQRSTPVSNALTLRFVERTPAHV